MTESLKEKALRQIAEMESLRLETRDAMVAANAARALWVTNQKDPDAMVGFDTAYALAVAKQNKLNEFLAAMAEDWRDKTIPPN